MPVISGKRAFLELLKQEGVEVLFGNPGTTELPLMDALAVDNEMRYVLGLQEAAVMAMADGYAQASGKLAVVNLHVTPGLGNAMGMLYDAQKAGSPILVTAGQHDQDFNQTEPILYAELPPIARPLVKWSSEVHRLQDLPLLVHRAAKTALAPPTGPVFLSLPGDILKNEADLDLMAPTRIAPHTRGDRAAIEAAAQILGAGETPGHHGGRRGRAEPRARRAGRARRADRRAGLCRTDRQLRRRSRPRIRCSAARWRARSRDAQDLRPARRAVLGRRRPVRAVAALRRGAGLVRPEDDPSRRRSVGAGQELSGRGRDPRRSEGHAARADRGAARAACRTARSAPRANG